MFLLACMMLKQSAQFLENLKESLDYNHSNTENYMDNDARMMRRKILQTSHNAKSGHIASAFSILEIMSVLFKSFIKDEDHFILSKGHGSLALYASLWNNGIITDEDLNSFCKYDSILGGHPDRNKVPKVAASTGSLGHGLPIAVGLALSMKVTGKSGKVYCIVGDGECNEGSIWEAALLADNLKLGNLICIVDNNRSQIRSIPTTDVIEKFKSFGFNVAHVPDGHDVEAIESAIKSCDESKIPSCIVCDTVKGYGIDSIAGDMFAWHHRSPTSSELDEFLREIEK